MYPIAVRSNARTLRILRTFVRENPDFNRLYQSYILGILDRRATTLSLHSHKEALSVMLLLWAIPRSHQNTGALIAFAEAVSAKTQLPSLDPEETLFHLERAASGLPPFGANYNMTELANTLSRQGIALISQTVAKDALSAVRKRLRDLEDFIEQAMAEHNG